jgi:hypothetical protein
MYRDPSATSSAFSESSARSSFWPSRSRSPLPMPLPTDNAPGRSATRGFQAPHKRLLTIKGDEMTTTSAQVHYSIARLITPVLCLALGVHEDNITSARGKVTCPDCLQLLEGHTSSVADLAAAVRGEVAEGERLAGDHQVELGPYDEIRHEHVLGLLAVIDAVADLPRKAAAFEESAAAKDPAGTAALQLNSRARGLRDAIDHITAALAVQCTSIQPAEESDAN